MAMENQHISISTRRDFCKHAMRIWGCFYRVQKFHITDIVEVDLIF